MATVKFDVQAVAIDGEVAHADLSPLGLDGHYDEGAVRQLIVGACRTVGEADVYAVSVTTGDRSIGLAVTGS